MTRLGVRKGESHRFILGHHVRLFTAETRRRIGDTQRGKTVSPEQRRKMSLAQGGTGEPGYGAIHRILGQRHPKTGVCEECGKAAERTDYAFQRHPEPHTLDREDYRELCQPCHNRLDRAAPREIAT